MTSISAIIPTWNRAITLKRAVLSVLNQTYPVSEIFVCDDVSTDGSKEIIEGIGDKRLKWLSGERAGMPSIPRNRGIKASTGEWIAFLDSDDEWLPKKIEKQLQAAEKFKTDAVCSNAFRIMPNNDSGKPYLNYEDNCIPFEKLVQSNYVICSSAMVKRSVINIPGGFPESVEFKAIEDYALWLKVATLTDFAFVKEPCVNYYDDPKQSIRDNKITEAEQREKIFGELCKWLELKNMKNTNYYSLAKNELNKPQRISRQGFLLTISHFFSKSNKPK